MQKDGVLSYFNKDALTFLKRNLSNRWIEAVGAINFLTYFPDLILSDFYISENLKNTLYQGKPKLQLTKNTAAIISNNAKRKNTNKI